MRFDELGRGHDRHRIRWICVESCAGGDARARPVRHAAAVRQVVVHIVRPARAQMAAVALHGRKHFWAGSNERVSVLK